MLDMPIPKQIFASTVYEKILIVRAQIVGIASLILSMHLTPESFFVHYGLRIIYSTYDVYTSTSAPEWPATSTRSTAGCLITNHCRLLNVQHQTHLYSDR